MQILLDLLVAAMGLVVVGQFVWGMRYHFKTDNLPLASKAISAIGALAVLLNLFLGFTLVQPIAVLIIGLAVMAGASILFMASIKASRETELYYVFEGRKPQSILQRGPYGRIRHPFYVSYLLLWAGWALAALHPVAGIPVIALIALYVNAARGEECAIMNSPLAGEYGEYRRRAGFFWPKFAFGRQRVEARRTE